MRELAGTIETVDGPLDAADLGFTLPHEHLLFDTSAWQLPAATSHGAALAAARVTLETYSDVFHDPLVCADNLVFFDEEVAAAEAGAFRAAGGTSIIDVTPRAMGRDVAAIRRVARASGVNVVVGTGHYVQATHTPEVVSQSVDQITEMMLAEIRNGIDGTDVRAGVIGEIGTSGDIHPDERKTLVAAAQAHVETGLAISVHCAIPYEKVALDVVRILEKAGADPARVVLGHMSHTIADLDYHRAAADSGAVLEYDRFGAEFV